MLDRRSSQPERGLPPARIRQFETFRTTEQQSGECSICFEDLEVGKNMLRLDCEGKHEFCQTCIEGWFKNHSTCPLCRHQFDTRSVLNRNFANTQARTHANVNGPNTGLNVDAGFNFSTRNAHNSPVYNLAMLFLLLAYHVSHGSLTLLLSIFVLILIMICIFFKYDEAWKKRK